MLKRRIGLLLSVYLLLYVGSYIALSRPAFEDARRHNEQGFYFFTPEDTDL